MTCASWLPATPTTRPGAWGSVIVVGFPDFSAAPLRLGFRDTSVGTTAQSRTITVSNPGSAALSTATAITGDHRGDLAITANSCAELVFPKLTANWRAGAGADSYRVTVRGKRPKVRRTATTAKLRRTVKPLASGKRYTVCVRSVSGAQTSSKVCVRTRTRR